MASPLKRRLLAQGPHTAAPSLSNTSSTCSTHSQTRVNIVTTQKHTHLGFQGADQAVSPPGPFGHGDDIVRQGLLGVPWTGEGGETLLSPWPCACLHQSRWCAREAATPSSLSCSWPHRAGTGAGPPPSPAAPCPWAWPSCQRFINPCVHNIVKRSVRRNAHVPQCSVTERQGHARMAPEFRSPFLPVIGKGPFLPVIGKGPPLPPHT